MDHTYVDELPETRTFERDLSDLTNAAASIDFEIFSPLCLDSVTATGTMLEKLIGKNGEIIERFSRYYPTVCACLRVCARGCASLPHCQPRASAPSLVCACARACACACALVPCATGQVSRVSTCACGMPSLKMHARIQADIAAHIEKAL